LDLGNEATQRGSPKKDQGDRMTKKFDFKANIGNIFSFFGVVKVAMGGFCHPQCSTDFLHLKILIA